ncbi:hypothetical protein AQUCO_02700375v1 [Aquilegia coerulea]|uniref:Protein kinase domain-containing protein n=1 Tax=Aquilegia coerulea TaxID=218851 RepID=A0A2G5D6L2_AQUCA|nr:hypothetical protein AQUCO_02700375v1 [Aquilegia coerulea]
MTNIIYHPPVSSCSSPDSSTNSSSHQVQNDQNLETSSLYSFIFFACTRSSPDLLEDDDNSTIPFGEGVTNHGEHFSESSKLLQNSAPPPSDREILQSSKANNFSYRELKVATKNFCVDNELGRTFFGRVYKGWIDKHTLIATKPQNGIPVAVKIFYYDRKEHDSKTQWLKHNVEWQNYHPNLVRLVGYCTEDEHRILVYEFVPHKSLEDHLFRKRMFSNHKALSWSFRMKVALGAAKGLAFLHNAETEVIHGNLKPSNIFIDSNYNAKLSDSKLAKVSGPTTSMGGIETIYGDFEFGVYSMDGYAAPEYYRAGRPTTKSDVYSFGLVLLEMLFGRQIVQENKPFWAQKEVMDAKLCLEKKGRLMGIIDLQLEGQYSLEGLYKVATIVLLCLSKDPTLRPSMIKVVTTLENVISLDVQNLR